VDNSGCCGSVRSIILEPLDTFILYSSLASGMSIEYRYPTIDDIKALNFILNQSNMEHPLHQDDTIEETMEFPVKHYHKDSLAEGPAFCCLDFLGF